MISIYDANATDFSTIGLATLDPSECIVEEKAGGLYELTITHPITDDLKHTLITQQRIIKAPVPMRETPLVEIGTTSGTAVVRHIYKVNESSGAHNMRIAADENSKKIGNYRNGTEVAVVGTSGSWSNVIVLNGGATGWMRTSNLQFVRDESETITGDTPGTVIQPRQTRDQLFRIYNVEIDNRQRSVIASAQHISYDIAGVIVASEYSPDGVSAAAVCSSILQKADHDAGFNIYCTVTDAVTLDCTGRGLLDIICNADDGILAQTGARLVRDNFDIFILPAQYRDRGVQLRYGKNLLSAYLRTDTSSIVTRIQPAGKTKDGDVLLIADAAAQSYVDSSHINDYPVVKAKRIEYDVVESDDLPLADARAKLRELAQADYDDNGIDLPSVTLDADFVRLELTADYAQLATAYALHLYDTVPVIDDEAGIVTSARMTGYKYDAIIDRYDTTELGELTDSDTTVYGYEIGGGVNGTKIVNGTLDGGKLRDASIYTAKIANASITTAKIDDAQITNAKIADAAISNAKIDNAGIEYAKIKEAYIEGATISSLITRDAVADKYFIDKLQVRNLQVLEQTVGSLIIKAANGSYYRLDIDTASGSVTPTLVSVSAAEIAAGVTADKTRSIIETDLTVNDLAASSIKSINALIDKLTAGRIDADELFARQAVISQLNAYSISNIKVGGTNILKGSAKTIDKISVMTFDPTVTVHAYEPGWGVQTYPDKWTRVYIDDIGSDPTYGGMFRARILHDGLTAGQQYTLSAEINNTGSNTVSFGAGNTQPVIYTQTGVYRASITFTAETSGDWLVIDTYVDRSAASPSLCTDIRKIKLETGNKPTDWCQADDELINSAITLDQEGVKISSSGTIQIDAGTAEDSHINLGDGNFSASKNGGVVAKVGNFEQLFCGGRKTLTNADIVVSRTQPDGHGIIWIQPNAVNSVSYTSPAYSSRRPANDFYNAPDRTITKTFTRVGSDTLTGTVTYSLAVPLYSVSTSTNAFALSVSISDGSTTVSLGAQTGIEIRPGTQTDLTFTASGANILTGNEITVTYSAQNVTGNVYIQSNITFELKCSVSATSGAQASNIYYIQ